MNHNVKPPTLDGDSLRERKKARVRAQIAAAAAALVHKRGLAEVSADDIAAAAEVGRATFFRYFDSKEAAVVAGFYDERLGFMAQALANAPADAAPLDVIASAFRQMSRNFDAQAEVILLQGRVMATSPTLRARYLEYHSHFEQLIAEAVAPHYAGKRDLRPRLLAAAALSVLRVATEYWVEAGGRADLPGLVAEGLEQLKHGFAPAQPSGATALRGGRASTSLRAGRQPSAKRR